MIGRLALKYNGAIERNATLPQLVSFLSRINPDIKSFSSILYYRGSCNTFGWDSIYSVVENTININCGVTKLLDNSLAYSENYIDFQLLSINPPMFYWNIYNK